MLLKEIYQSPTFLHKEKDAKSTLKKSDFELFLMHGRTCGVTDL